MKHIDYTRVGDKGKLFQEEKCQKRQSETCWFGESLCYYSDFICSSFSYKIKVC